MDDLYHGDSEDEKMDSAIVADCEATAGSSIYPSYTVLLSSDLTPSQAEEKEKAEEEESHRRIGIAKQPTTGTSCRPVPKHLLSCGRAIGLYERKRLSNHQ